MAYVVLIRTAIAGYDFDEASVEIGHGKADFERARIALLDWKHFDLGWVEMARHTGEVAMSTDPKEGVSQVPVPLNGSFQ